MSQAIDRFSFASDTVTGVCEEAWEALREADGYGGVASYGEDVVTEAAEKVLQETFGRPCAVHFVSSATAANALALSLIAAPWDGVLCHAAAHIHRDEANAPELMTSGAKLLTVDGALGKIDPANIPRVFEQGHGYHSAAPSALSVTQSTEFGTVYNARELESVLAALPAGTRVHMDGARFANAVVALKQSPHEMVRGIDVLTFGCSKNGGPPTEAIICFREELLSAEKRTEIKRRLKRAGLLVAKMRYLSAPWLGMLRSGAWLRNAAHANQCALELSAGFEREGLELAVPVETNQIFVHLPEPIATALEKRDWHFYRFADLDAYRFVTSWNTSADAISGLLQDLASVRMRSA